MDLLTKMIEHHIWLIGQMIERAGKLDDERLDRPIQISVDADRQTLRSLLSRLVGQMDMWNSAIASRDYDWSVEQGEPLAAMRARLTEVGPTFLAHVRGATSSPSPRTGARWSLWRSTTPGSATSAGVTR